MPQEATIMFCPELDLYRYVVGEEEKRFSSDELVASMGALEVEGKTAERDSLALITALARKKPHERVKVSVGG